MENKFSLLKWGCQFLLIGCGILNCMFVKNMQLSVWLCLEQLAKPNFSPHNIGCVYMCLEAWMTIRVINEDRRHCELQHDHHVHLVCTISKLCVNSYAIVEGQ